MPGTTVASSFRNATDNFQCARALAGQFSQDDGGTRLTLARSCERGLPISFDVLRDTEYDGSIASSLQKTWDRVTDNLWSSRRTARNRLHSATNIKDWVVRELWAFSPGNAAREAESKRKDKQKTSTAAVSGSDVSEDVQGYPVHGPVTDRILRELWPDVPMEAPARPTVHSLQNLKLNCTAAERSFNTWLEYTDHAGPFNRENIDRRQTRIERNRLTLVYKFEGTPVQFTFEANKHSPRAMRDLHRLHRVATDKGARYQNLAGLVADFMVATVEDEVPARLHEYVQDHFVDSALLGPAAGSPKHQADPHKFLLAQPNGKLTRTARRAVDAAVKECSRACVERAREMARRWNEIAEGDRGDVLRAQLGVAFRAIAAQVPGHNNKHSFNKGDFSHDIPLQFGWEPDTHELPPTGAIIIHYRKEPAWGAKVLGFFRQKIFREPGPRSADRVVAMRWNDQRMVHLPNDPDGAATLARSLRLRKTLPDKLAAVAREVYLRPFHQEWLVEQRKFRNEVLAAAATGPLGIVPSGNGDEDNGNSNQRKLRELMGPLRVGRCTFADIEGSEDLLLDEDVHPGSPQNHVQAIGRRHVRLVHGGETMTLKSDEAAMAATVYGLLTGSPNVQDIRGMQAATTPDALALWKDAKLKFRVPRPPAPSQQRREPVPQ
ncbi:hypothetical protein L602_001600000010, partial [Cupriavidus gilardii J11]